MTVALNAKTLDLIKAGRKVLNFTVGEPDFPTPAPVVAQAIESLQKGRTKYGPAGGSLPLRKAISKKLADENHLTYAPEEVVVGIGAKEILFHCFLALLNPGDKVVLFLPYWLSYADQVKAAGGIPLLVQPDDLLHPEKINMEKLEALITREKPKVIVFNSPNNPSGFMYSRETYQQVAEILRASAAWIISDEIYEYFAFDARHVSLIEVAPELKERFIYVNGLSKGYFMTGWRVGYCASSSKPFIQLLRSLQSHSSTCLPGFTEDASVTALTLGRNLVERDLKIMDQRRRKGAAFLENSNVAIIEPRGAFYFFMDVRAELARRQIDSMAFANELLEHHDIALIPGEAFGYPGFMRLSYSHPESVMLEGLTRFVAALRKS